MGSGAGMTLRSCQACLRLREVMSRVPVARYDARNGRSAIGIHALRSKIWT